jgi:protein-disulfide isomerase
MTDTKITHRIPLILSAIGLVLLGATALYIFRQKAPVETSVESANKSADKAIAAAGMNAADRAATEAIVRAYILEHPEIISDAITVLQKREVGQRVAQAGDQLHTPFPGAEDGNASGDVTIVEFSDYNCGFCRSSVADVRRLIDDDNGIRLVFREVPILAQTSKEAALWALAAAKQGKHRAFHKAMFSGARPDDNSIRAAAVVAGMDIAAAQAFATSNEAKAELVSNLGMMQKIGFSGTPTFIIGDQVLEGAVGYDALKAAVAKARKAKG